MIGMQTVIELRRGRVKPSAVFVSLVERLGPLDTERYAMSPSGIVEVSIERADSLAGIDFRPLTGLMVVLHDHTSDTARHRRVAAEIARIKPSHLVMPVWEGDTLAVHQRWQAEPTARTETYRVWA